MSRHCCLKRECKHVHRFTIQSKGRRRYPCVRRCCPHVNGDEIANRDIPLRSKCSPPTELLPLETTRPIDAFTGPANVIRYTLSASADSVRLLVAPDPDGEGIVKTWCSIYCCADSSAFPSASERRGGFLQVHGIWSNKDHRCLL